MRSIGLSLVFALPAVVFADVRPHGMFTDQMVLQRDMMVAVWGTADDGENVSVKFRDKSASAVAENGKWLVKIGPFTAGGPDVLTIEGKNKIELKDVLVGEVWVASGQSNMEWPMARTHEADRNISEANYPQIRLFTVQKNVQPKPVSEVKGSWSACTPESVRGFSAVAYFFGRKLHKDLNVPIGLINSSWGGTPAESWTSEDCLAAEPRLKTEILDPFVARVEQSKTQTDEPKNKKKRQSVWNAHSPASLYNGMIAPIINYGIRGAIWYQGESNAGRADQYRVLFPKMIQCWRSKWGQEDFPFLFVQLAPFKSSPVWAELRESQRETDRNLANTAMAVITDWGDARDIHPQHKMPVGERLASAALVDVYKKPGIGHSPDLKSATVMGDAIVCEFEHADNGLEIRGGTQLTGFTICGSDGNFVPATAELQGNKVIVRSDAVREPKAVRFGWSDLPTGNLFNKEGFPVTPFRSDDFPFQTATRRR